MESKRVVAIDWYSRPGSDAAPHVPGRVGVAPRSEYHVTQEYDGRWRVVAIVPLLDRRSVWHERTLSAAYAACRQHANASLDLTRGMAEL